MLSYSKKLITPQHFRIGFISFFLINVNGNIDMEEHFSNYIEAFTFLHQSHDIIMHD